MKMGCSICGNDVLETNDNDMQSQLVTKIGLLFCVRCGIKYSYLTEEASGST